jgi:tetratricopeptide (TPR) repeat protein
MNKNIIITCVLLFFVLFAAAQKTHQYLKAGDEFYKKGDFANAEQSYRIVEDSGKSSGRSAFNLGNALYQQKRYDEAIESYNKASQQLWNEKDAAQAYYNLGNAYFEKADYPKSIEAYKNALRRDPNILSAKKNLTLAQRKLKEKEQQQQKQQPQNRPPSNEPNNGNSQPPQPSKSQSTKNQTEQERLLKVAAEEEKRTQQRAQQQKAKSQPNSEKDW